MLLAHTDRYQLEVRRSEVRKAYLSDDGCMIDQGMEHTGDSYTLFRKKSPDAMKSLSLVSKSLYYAY
jgi:hypothetical protein